MADYSTFEYGSGVVYGSGSAEGPYTLGNVEFVAQNVLRFRFTGDIVINSDLTNTSNYSVVFTDNNANTNVSVRKVLTLDENAYVTDEVYVQIDPSAVGTNYDISVTGLLGRNGDIISPSIFTRKARFTKTDSSLVGIPRHFDKTPESNVRHLLTAVTRADDTIGGDLSEPVLLPTNVLDAGAGLGAPITAQKIIHWADGTFDRPSSATYWDGEILTTYPPNTVREIRDGVFLEHETWNELTYSNDFTQAIWIKEGTSSVEAGFGDPAGGFTATKFTVLGGATNDSVFQRNAGLTAAFPDNTDITFSMFLKAVSGTVDVRLRASDKATAFISSSSEVMVIDDVWRRYSYTFNTSAGAENLGVFVSIGTNPTYEAGEVLIFGAQLEERKFVTSYVPTTSVRVFRNIDSLIYPINGELDVTHRLTITPIHDRVNSLSGGLMDFLRGQSTVSRYAINNSDDFVLNSDNVTVLSRPNTFIIPNEDLVFTVYPTLGKAQATGFTDPVWVAEGTPWSLPAENYNVMGILSTPVEGYISDVYQVF